MKDMKKIMIFAAIAAASLAVFSCAQVEQDVLTKDGVFVLSLDSGEMETRTVDTNFETAIDHFDFFFFSDAEGTTPIEGMHGRATGSSKVLDTQVGAEFEALRNGTSYVYVLANYPSALDHTHDWKLDDILALDVTSPIATAVDEETGAVTFTDNLVMDSWRVEGTDDVYTVELTPTKIQEERDVTVPLARLAAKISVHINVTPSVTIGNYVWKSRPELLKGYFVNALNNKATVAGTPVKRSAIPEASVDDYQYLTYPTNYPLAPAPAEDVYEYDLDPVYTYPQEWTSDDNGEPYFKFQMPWINERPDTDGIPSMGSSNFYYKVTVPKPESGSWTLKRNTCYEVDLTLSMLNPQDDYIEVQYGITVVPWADSGRPGGDGLSAARFFSVPTKTFTMYSEGALDIPFSSSSAVDFYFTNIKYTHYGAANKQDNTFSYPYNFDFDEADHVKSVTLPTTDSNGNTVLSAAKDTNPYKLTLNGKSVHFEHNLSKVYTVREITLVIKSRSGRPGDVATVVIRQHPAIEIEKIPAAYGFVNGHFARNDMQVHDKYGNFIGSIYGPTTNYDTGLYKVHSHEHLGTHSGTPDIDLSSYGLCNIYSDWTPSVKAGQMFMTKITVSAFSEDDPETTVDESNDTYKMSDGGVERIEHFVIGDPRVPASTHYTTSSTAATAAEAGWTSSNTTNFWLPPYLVTDSVRRTYNETTGAWEETDGYEFEHGTWEEPMKVLISSQGTDMRNVIAPRFMISSTLNGMHNGVRFDGSVRRAATYQEGGYPAGRWRLPTEAEIAFIVARQRDGSIPELFVFSSTKYWCANRSYVTLGSEGSTAGINTAAAGSNAGFNRFVYDLWYWGDDPVDDPGTYHPNMHEH